MFTNTLTDKPNRPTAEERAIAQQYGRQYARGTSWPRLVDIASASARGKADVIAVMRAFVSKRS